ncbi:MarR family transcriptional regulator [Sporanaerobium hydrogeniformans]|uniref:MarR family transcriptional regulator n=1 Tax=Sporanaerobium hydrogeniformans TaxID=3072179 RepID=A0AC61DCG5_9FIRM|nr:MarR family transcriptional regulator [Sporanaerobium hydrogeniformans]PHV70421.1 MarR family transcriptional regulator [Sporanaerobium hydrogeniformans]
MSNSMAVVSDLLINVFNSILAIEKQTLERGALKEVTLSELHTIEAIGLSFKRMTEVASLLNINVSTLTVSINKLVKKGYVERKYSEEDRRVVLVGLTHKGMLAYRIHESFHAVMVKVMIKGLKEEECKELIDSLKRLNTFFKDEYGLNR